MLWFLRIMRMLPGLSKSSFGGERPKVVWHRGVIFTFMVVAFVLPNCGDTCELFTLGINNLSYSTVSNSKCDTWTVNSGSGSLIYRILTYCNHQLLLEFWRLAGRNSTRNTTELADRSFTDVHFEASVKSLSVPWYTHRDEVGYRMGRPYQRILIPMINSYPSYEICKVTVSAPKEIAIIPYALRVSCAPLYDPPPCPRPDISQPDRECGTHGVCVRGSYNGRECRCHAGWGDVDCQTPAPALSNGAVVSKLLKPGEWAFWQVNIPLPLRTQPASGQGPVLLVEMGRGGDGVDDKGTLGRGPSGIYGGDPFLFVMAKGANDSNRVPYYDDSDIKNLDAMSVLLQQNFHFRLVDLVPTSAPESTTAEYYVAVYNYDRRFSEIANVTLRVRWTNSSSDRLCPNNCYGPDHGTCDPQGKDPLSAWLDPADSYGFQCACKPGYGGPLCEGTLKNVSLSTHGEVTSNITLQPGEWSFFVMAVDRSNFDTTSFHAEVHWDVRGGQEPYENALFTFDTGAFPRFPSKNDISSMWRNFFIYPSIWNTSGMWPSMVTSYASLFGSGPPEPILISGYKFSNGSVNVLGFYNSDYRIQVNLTYNITIFVVTAQSHSWGRSDMLPIILGLSSSFFLVMLLAIGWTVLQRYGWGPFRPRSADGGGADGNMSRVQMMPRHRGVPAHVIDTFHYYKYQATREEKAQLAKSKPEAQQPPSPRGDGPMELALHNQIHGGGVEGNPFQAVGAATATAIVTATATVQPPTSASAGGGAGTGSGSGTDTGMAPAAAKDDDEEPQCAVCLCEYEEGEVITQLPCKHDFHGICIRKWLQTHITCPICRVSLQPNQPESSEAGNGADRSITQSSGAQDQTPPSEQRQLQRLTPRLPPPGRTWAQPPLSEATEAATGGTGRTLGDTSPGVLPAAAPAELIATTSPAWGYDEENSGGAAAATPRPPAAAATPPHGLSAAAEQPR